MLVNDCLVHFVATTVMPSRPKIVVKIVSIGKKRLQGMIFPEHDSLWSPYGLGQTIIFSSCGFFYLSSLFFSSPNLGHHLYSAGRPSRWVCKFRMQVWSVVCAAGWKYRTQKNSKNRHLGTIAQLCRAISSQLRHLATIGKKLVKQQYLPTCPHNMANFGPLAAEIGSLVWGTPTNFNGFRVLAALLHGTPAVGSGGQ